MSEPIAVLDGATKRFDGRPVLDNCSMHVMRGEVLGVAGPNGAGKTTLARLLLGFSLPSSGSVLIDGLDPITHRLKHGVGYAPEEPERPWPYTVRELLATRAEGTDRLDIDGVVRSTGIEPLLGKRIDRISKGEWRLTVVAYALIGAPSLIVLDEPDSGLDPDALDRLHDAVRLAIGAGSTMVILSHNLDELERLCDRIIIIQQGQLRATFVRRQFLDGGMRNLYREATRT